MSGFCGQFNWDGRPAAADDLTSAMDALSHHGRDGRGVWTGGPVAFGHQMLHVTPESIGETLPCYQPQPGLAITGDFRLDNREELLAACAAPRELWPATPDSAIILLAYERWGEACVDHLLGDFAFAIWDESAQRLFCARDFIGVKPFYYHATNNSLYFASDITGLLAFPTVSDELDLRYVRSYLEYGRFYHLEYSFFEDVRKLPPGHTLIVSAGGLNKRRYWSAANSPKIRYKRDDEYFDHLRTLLDTAVSARLRSVFPVGSHLSGGLDSSIVAVLAARALRQRGETLHGFSWAPPSGEFGETHLLQTDERHAVQAVCEAEGIVPVYTPFRSEDLVADWMMDITRHPEHTLIYETTTSRIAEAMGKRVMLSGWGGDETVAFNGRGYFADLLRHGRWITMTRELAMRTRIHQDDFWGSLRSRAILPLLPDWLVRGVRPELMDERMVPLPVNMLQPAFSVRLSETASYPQKNLRERPGARQYQIRLVNHGHLTNRLESWADNGGRRGIEYCYPLLDRRIVEFSFGVPAYLFHYQGWKRYLFREAAKNILPDAVRWRKYKGEPAMAQTTQDVLPDAQRLLLLKIESRRADIQRAGYVEANVFLAEMNKILDEPTDGSDAFQVLWLAQL